MLLPTRVEQIKTRSSSVIDSGMLGIDPDVIVELDVTEIWVAAGTALKTMQRRGVLKLRDVVGAQGEFFDSIIRLIQSKTLSSVECFVQFSGCRLPWDIPELRILDQEGTALP